MTPTLRTARLLLTPYVPADEAGSTVVLLTRTKAEQERAGA
ncbi:hypothetical protein AB0P21_30005 [Kribbella sp. NPDC056861]